MEIRCFKLWLSILRKTHKKLEKSEEEVEGEGGRGVEKNEEDEEN